MSTSVNPVVNEIESIAAQTAYETSSFQRSGEPFAIEELRERLARWLSIPQEDEDLIDSAWPFTNRIRYPVIPFGESSLMRVAEGKQNS